MTFGRKIAMVVTAAFAMAFLSAAAQAQGAAKAPLVYSPEVNMCRAACGDAWLKARTCNQEAAVCLKRADRSYAQCLPDCQAGKAPLANSFAWVASQRPASRATPIRAAASRADDGPDSTAAAPWVDARAEWAVMPVHTRVALPYTFAVPSSAYAYAGLSLELRPFVMKAPGLLKVELIVTEGRVGVALVTPDGSALVSKEAALKPSPAVQSVYFEIGPQSPPVALVLRNYDAEGQSGSATVRAVTFARTKVLPPGEAERLGALK